MKFGLKLGNVDRLPLAEGVGRLAVEAEQCGFDSVWVADHIVVPRQYALDAEHALADAIATGQHGDALISLAYVAGQTKRVLLGTAVMVLPLRNPLAAAKMLATLDVLSGGRVVLGAGVGWLESEFAALRAPDFTQRGKVADEWIRILRTCWTEPFPAFEGEYYSFPPLHFSPQPAKPIPIWIGGNSAPALRRAGTLGDGWHGSRVGVAELPALIAKVRQAAEAAGRDPHGLSFALGMEIDIVEGAERNAAGLLAPERGLIGTPGEIVERIQALEAAGIQHLELRFRPMRDTKITTIEPTLDMLRRFASEVMPKLSR